jgi:hypothetical protein
VEHAFDRRQSEFRAAMGKLDAADKLDASIDLLWSMFSGPTFVACSELWGAARTDPDLARCVVEVDRRFMATSKQMYADLFAPENAAADVPYPEVGLHLIFALLDGLAMTQVIPGYQPHPAEEVIEAFKAMVRVTTAALQPAGSQT